MPTKVILFALLATVAAPLVTLAQSTNGTISGTVSDAGGGSVPKAAVAARNVGTDIQYPGTTAEDGTFLIPNLPAGQFEVTAEAPGFRRYVRSGLILDVAQRLRLDMRLDLGSVSEAVTVAGEIPRVQTDESSLGTTVETQRIEQLPLNGRHILNLVRIAPGVQPKPGATDGFGDTRNLAISQIHFNGGPVFGNQVLLDGGANISAYEAEIAVTPIADTIQEFRVETNALRAEYGQTNGGVVTSITKSGTNQLHGSAYEFVRNDAFDARNAFATQRDPVTGRIKPILRYNQYGGTIGGPVVVPKVYDGRSRTFFFFGMEEWNYRTQNIKRATIPTALEQSGNFSQTRDARGSVIQISDPATTRPNPNGSGYIRDVFPGNIVPQQRFDPVSRKIASFFPLPNATPTNAFTNSNNYLGLIPNPTDIRSYNGRVDHRFSDADSMMIRYTNTLGQVVGNGYGLGPADSDGLARTDQRDNHNAVLTETHVFSPRLINELRLNITRSFLTFTHPSTGGDWPNKLGLPAVLPRDYFPRIDTDGILSLGGTNFITGKRGNTLFQAYDSVSLIRGRHQIKIGTDLRWSQINWINSGYRSGRFTFTTSMTGDPLNPAGTGVGFASLVLGTVTGGQVDLLPAFAFKYWTGGTYIQDTFKITKNLTLDLGLRWDIAGSPVDRFNQYSNFNPAKINPQTGLPGVLEYAGKDHPREFVGTDWKRLGPRFGFAWNVTGDGKTALRGGFGVISILSGPGDVTPDNSNALGFSATTTFQSAVAGIFPAFSMAQGPTSVLQPAGSSGGPGAYRGQTVYFQQYNPAEPYMEQWNLTMEREVLPGWSAAVSYAGSRGVHLLGGNYDLNQLNPAYLAQGLALQDLVTNPFAGQITTGGLSAARIARSQILRPLPDYQSVFTLANHNASSTYHALEVALQHRFSRGLSLLVAYTNSKMIDNASSSLGNQSSSPSDFRLGAYNQRIDRALDIDDVSQRLVVSGVYELPFGAGKRWLGGSRGIVNGVLGGWQVNTVTTAQTGVPLAVRGANNFSGINFPDLVANPSAANPSVDQWFNTNAFRNPADFTVGNAPRTLPSTRAPGVFDLTLSLFKTFQIRERARLETRVESFNAVNHVNRNAPDTSFSPNRQGVNGNGNFGHITSALNARTIQLGMRLAF